MSELEQWKKEGKHPYRCAKDNITESIPAHLTRGCHGPWIVESVVERKEVPLK